MNFLRFSDLCAQGKARRPARLHPRRPQRAAGRRRPHHRRHAHPRLGSLHPDGAGRRRGRDGHLAPGPPDRGRIQARGFAGAGGRSAWANCWAARSRWCATGSTASTSRPARSCCWRTAASTRARRRTTRHWRRRWPRCATSSCTTPSAPRTAPRPRPTASRSTRRSPAPARCWRPRSTRSPRRWRIRSARWWPSWPAPRSRPSSPS